MPTKRAVKHSEKSQQERRSGRHSDISIRYTEEESDDYSSGSNDEIHEEIDKIIENIPDDKTPKKKKNEKTGQEKRKANDEESEMETDSEEETNEKTTQRNPNKKSPAKSVKNRKKIKSAEFRNDDGKKCKVCGRTSDVGMNYGVQSCKPCQKFFRNHHDHAEDLICREDDSCDLDSTKTLIICQKCRYDKCIELGMKREEPKESYREGSRKSSRIQSLEKNYKEMDEESDEDEDIYLPLQKKKRKPNYYESSGEEIIDSSDSEGSVDDPNDVSWNPSHRKTFEQVSYGKNREKKKNCDVCRQYATLENGYCVESCAECVEIFRKALNRNHIPRCISKSKKCDVQSGKSKCKFCRVVRYLKLTMESSKFQYEKYKEKAERLEDVLYSENPQKFLKDRDPCKICGDTAYGVNLGVMSCKSCVDFFRKCMKGKYNTKKFKCLENDMCSLSKGKDPVKYRAGFCRDCRYKTCLKVGMTLGTRPADE